MTRRFKAVFARLAALCLVVALVTGCAQSTDTLMDQLSGQELITPTMTDQDAATQGSSVNIWVLNAPGRGGAPTTPLAAIGSGDGIRPLIDRLAATANDTKLEGTDAGYAQAGINITVTTGGTTPSLTGTTTATASGSQTPGAELSVSPVQDVRPDTGISIPVAIAPGGGNVIDQAAAATGGEGSTSLDKTSENELRWARLEAAEKQLEQLIPLLESVLGIKVDPAAPGGCETKPEDSTAENAENAKNAGTDGQD